MFADQPAVCRLAFAAAIGFLVKLLSAEAQVAVELVLSFETALERGDVECVTAHIFLTILDMGFTRNKATVFLKLRSNGQSISRLDYVSVAC